MWPFGQSILVGGIGRGSLEDVTLVSDYLTELGRASNFTTIVSANSVMELFYAWAFKVEVWNDIGCVISMTFVDTKSVEGLQFVEKAAGCCCDYALCCGAMFVEKLVNESNRGVFAFEQEYPDVLCCCIDDEEVTAKAVVAFDDGFLWRGAVMEYFLEIFGSLNGAEIHVE